MLLLHSKISVIVYNILYEDTRLTRHTTDITIIATSWNKVQFLRVYVCVYGSTHDFRGVADGSPWQQCNI